MNKQIIYNFILNKLAYMTVSEILDKIGGIRASLADIGRFYDMAKIEKPIEAVVSKKLVKNFVRQIAKKIPAEHDIYRWLEERFIRRFINYYKPENLVISAPKRTIYTFVEPEIVKPLELQAQIQEYPELLEKVLGKPLRYDKSALSVLQERKKLLTFLKERPFAHPERGKPVTRSEHSKSLALREESTSSQTIPDQEAQAAKKFPWTKLGISAAVGLGALGLGALLSARKEQSVRREQ